MSASYDKTESITIGGKAFHYTPDRKEFLDGLVGKYPDQSVFSKEEIETLGPVPYWMNNTKRYPFKEATDSGVIFNLEAVVSGYNGGYEPQTVVPVKPVAVAVPAVPKPNNSPVAAQTEMADINLLSDDLKIVPEKMSN